MTIAYRDANGDLRYRAATGAGSVGDPDVTVTAITAAALPLPTGAATETTLSSVAAALGTTLDVDGSGVTQPISAAALPLPTGAATEATLSSVVSALSSVAVTGPLTNAQLRATPVPTTDLNEVAARFTLFGQRRAVAPTIVFVTTPSYDVDPLRWEIRASGASNGGAWNANKRQTDLTLTNAGYVVAQSRRYVVYEPGRPVRVTQTGALGTHRENVTVRWGQFDAANGLFWERSATGVLRCGKRSSVSGSVVDTYYDQGDWNGPDTLPAGFDASKNQVWLIEYAWLGTAGARWGVFTPAGFRYVHTQIFSNASDVSYMQTATLPLRVEVSATDAPATPAVVGKVCAEVESEGGYFTQAAFPFAAGRLNGDGIATTALVPLVALRPALTFGGIPNHVQIEAQDVHVLATGAPVDWRLLYYPPGTTNPVTGGTWAAATHSATEVNVSGTALSATGAIELARGGVPSAGGGGGGLRALSQQNTIASFPLVLDMAGSNNPLTSNAGANPAYLVLAAIGAGGTASGGIEWWETR